MSELVVQGTELAPSTLFGTDNHGEIVARASDLARTLEQVVRKQNLVVKIGQSEHVRVEGWTFLGSMLGVFPVVEWTRPVMLDEVQVGWEARVEARTRSGEIVGAAEAECLRSERTWGGRDDYALRSMAQTRAVSKALRLPLGFVMQLAGFNPTPAEEMPVIEARYVDPAAGTPFAYDPDELPAELTPEPASSGASTPPESPAPEGAPDVKMPSKAKKTKLDILVNQLRDAGHLTTLQLWQSMGREPVLGLPDEQDGILHWRTLRDQLNDEEASALLARLADFAVAKAAA